MVGTATFGVWNSSDTLVYTFGTLDLSTITGSYVAYAKTNSDISYTVATNDRIGVFFSGSNTTTNIQYQNTNADSNISGVNPNSSQVWTAGDPNQDCNMILEQLEDYYSATDSLDTTFDNWRSTTETNPNIYYDLGSDKDLAGLLINVDKTNTTETEINIRCSTDATFTSGEVVRTILISDFTDDVDRFITIPRLLADKRYVQIYGSSGSSVKLALNYIKYIAPSDFVRKHFHYYLDPTISSNSLDSN